MSTTEQCSSLHWRIPHFRFLWSLEEFAQCFQSETCFSKSLNFKKLPSISLLIDSIKRTPQIKENLYFERKNQLINAFFDLMVVFCQNSCHFICPISVYVYVVMWSIKVTFCGKNCRIINNISKKECQIHVLWTWRLSKTCFFGKNSHWKNSKIRWNR